MLDDLMLYQGEGQDTDALYALRSFKHTLYANSTETDENENLHIEAINTYTRAIVKVDTEVPYLLNVDGYVLIPPSDELNKELILHANNLLFSATELVLYCRDLDKNKPENTFMFGLHGILHSADPEKPGKYILVPLQSVTSLKSLRDVVPKPTPNTSVSE